MGIKHRVTDKGIVSFLTDDSDTSGVVRGFSAGDDGSQGTVSSNTTFTGNSVGSLVLSSSTAAVTGTMPDPALMPGSRWIFRAGSAHAHRLTSSLGATTTPFTNGTSKGQRCSLDAAVNSSVVLMSDGANWVVLGNSGTLAFT